LLGGGTKSSALFVHFVIPLFFFELAPHHPNLGSFLTFFFCPIEVSFGSLISARSGQVGAFFFFFLSLVPGFWLTVRVRILGPRVLIFSMRAENAARFFCTPF